LKKRLKMNSIQKILPALRMILSKDGLKTLKVRKDCQNDNETNTLFFHQETPEAVLSEAIKEVPAFIEKFGYQPKLLFIKGIGLVEVGENTSSTTVRRAENKTIIVTGAAQGFGEGIAACLLQQGANIVVADLNEEIGKATVERFNTIAPSRALFVKTNVSDIPSIENLVYETICNFGAIDCFISNAGVLRAGGLDDMSPEDFDFVTKINYNAYFYCTKVVSRIMKLQTKYATNDYYADIIQINSKSGLRGSKANFAYAGGKFGGIGLTQSFALELAPNRIKVNSVCPGNYYEGSLWSDPENGLFVQYLRAGKVPGAKTIDDVKAFYLAQVPMNKGCNPEDVTKGVLYLMEQCGETGQALPITGGQVMLN
jgi:NAD(P)-dependent dehydrogenase (short-subunit alcohol dehydrogenase family)